MLEEASAAIEVPRATAHPSVSRDSRPSETLVLHGSHGTVLIAPFDLAPPFESRLHLLVDPDSPQAVHYRLLRHRLKARGDPAVILISSAARGEGKTTCAANLALAIAEERTSSVLYLDASLERPALPVLFGLQGVRGVLSGITVRSYPLLAPRDSALRLASISDQELPRGGLPSAITRVAFAALREAHDYIVVDAGSVLESADPNLLAELADGVVLTARRGRTRRGSLRDAVNRLESSKLAGVVLLDARGSRANRG